MRRALIPILSLMFLTSAFALTARDVDQQIARFNNAVQNAKSSQQKIEALGRLRQSIRSQIETLDESRVPMDTKQELHVRGINTYLEMMDPEALQSKVGCEETAARIQVADHGVSVERKDSAEAEECMRILKLICGEKS